MSQFSVVAVYGASLLASWAGYSALRARRQRRALSILNANRASGLMEPASLHPVINPNRCIGCASCVSACPEGDVLGIVDGRARLINPTHCIGHGACKAACPMDAITLVFGTEKRGVEIPLVKPNFETNVPGIFIAGELGGMGLIRNAIEQGRQAMESIRAVSGIGTGEQLDVVIVGAGPSGFSASLAAMQHKLRYVTLEQDSLGGTVFQFPRGKIVMTAPVNIPLVGLTKIRETTKEALLELWQAIERKTGVKIRYNERMESIEPVDDGFLVKSSQASYRTRSVLLAIGRRGTPRKLGVPGESLSKVVYRLIDPEQYRNRHVLVVGGGDSALEAATSIADEPGATVTLSYRADSFSRSKEKNRERVAAAEQDGRLRVLLKSDVERIDADRVVIRHQGQAVELKNDAVIVCAGGVLPTPFLKQIGIMVDTKHGTP
ncbi:MAG TPA: NAD(P)-binding domain-containing protein [Methylococcaceae bacterium]|nr:NAD(P)-binding domain-containing protein [Methylococcaceae bacterium]